MENDGFHEPWSVTRCNDSAVEITDDHGDMVLFEEFSDEPVYLTSGAQRRAYRITDCVNACAGIDDPAATLAAVRDFLRMNLGHYQAKADALLESLGSDGRGGK